jgi:hypothetical protein
LVYRGWRDADVDFVSGNTFKDISGCLESPMAKPSCGSCPTL